MLKNLGAKILFHSESDKLINSNNTLGIRVPMQLDLSLQETQIDIILEQNSKHFASSRALLESYQLD